MKAFFSPPRLKIIQIGEPMLHQPTRCLTKEEILSPRLQELIECMKTTMREAPGVGLAAPQIGVNLQLVTIEDRAEYHQNLSEVELNQKKRKPVPFHVLINPVLKIIDPTPVEFFEGCLSAQGLLALTPRASAVEVKALNEKAQEVLIQAEGWYARILQHEFDHLQGRLYLSRAYQKSIMTHEAYVRHWKKSSIEDIKSIFSIT